MNYKGPQYITLIPFHESMSLRSKYIVEGDIHTQKDMVIQCFKLAISYEMWTLPNNTLFLDNRFSQG
jgi:hypothetical protein